jgi:hypothetical protein
MKYHTVKEYLYYTGLEMQHPDLLHLIDSERSTAEQAAREEGWDKGFDDGYKASLGEAEGEFE